MSPKYKILLIKSIKDKIWEVCGTYDDVNFYIKDWQEWNPSSFSNNFDITLHLNGQIDLKKTLYSIDEETLLKIAIDIGVDTPDIIPSVPIFKNEIKANYFNAHETFEKALKAIESEPDIAIGLANSTLEGIIKEILKDERISLQYNNTDTLYKQSISILKAFNLYPNSTLPNDIKTIGSSLLSLCKAIENIRSTQTNFHGKTSDDYVVSNPMYAYLVVNSVCSIGLFLMSYYKAKFPKNEIKSNPPPPLDNNYDLPF